MLARLKQTIFVLALLFSGCCLFADSVSSLQLIPVQKTYEVGTPMPLLIQLTLPEGSHTYWEEKTESEIAPSFRWKLPSEVQLVELQWPMPRDLEHFGVHFLGYEGTVTWIAYVQSNQKGSYPIEVAVSWIECNGMCSPKETVLKSHLNVGTIAVPDDTKASLWFEALAQIVVNKSLDASSLKEKKSLMPVPSSIVQEKGAMANYAEKGIWYFLLIGFVGGLILNFMPCVLPVVSLKVLHYVSPHKRSYLSSLFSALSYTLGILVSFWILTLLLFFLHRADASFGWGFQLQNPHFVTFMFLLFLLISANLFGLFEFGSQLASWAGSQEEDVKNRLKKRLYLTAFFSGVLTTLVATPCTGPLLGAIIGFSSSLGSLQSLILFTSIGLGLASPFLLFALLPESISSWILPKPGAWMDTMRQFFGFILCLSALWLLWVLSFLVPDMVYEAALLGAFLLFFASWLYGKSQVSSQSLMGKIAFFSSLVVMTLAIITTAASFHAPLRKTLSSVLVGKAPLWQPFSCERLNKELKEGKIVLVDGSARWCLTCQANELVFAQEDLQAFLREKQVILLKADWTTRDLEVTEWLHSVNRNGVPTIALYKEGREVILLPELITPEIVKNGVLSMLEETK